MGWYTTNGSDTFSYKYGDVRALANSARIGSLSLVPRLAPLDEAGEAFDAERFLGPIQACAVRLALPWAPLIPFDPDDASGESVRVPCDIDVGAVFGDWLGILRSNLPSVLAALRHLNELPTTDDSISQLLLSTDVIWTLPEAEYPELVAWLNVAIEGAPALTLESLRAGVFDEFDDYEPSEAAAPALEWLCERDPARHLAARALGHALVEGSPLELFQPDDMFEEWVWRAGRE
jgi:hypothetical protein